MGKHLGCDVDWELAPSLAICYSEGYFRDSQGRYWNEDLKEWGNGGYTNEELAQATDFEHRPKENKMEDTAWERLVEPTTPTGTSVVTPTKPIKSDGGSSSYYDIPIPDWLFDKICERRYSENCYIKTEELIEIMGDSFNQGTILKSLVRLNSLLNGIGKEGNSVDYECNKIIYYANRIKEENGR